MSYTRTSLGHDIWFDAPDPSLIDIRDIAFHLSNINRYAGAAKLRVNVASHSLDVARLLASQGAPLPTQLIGLLHDAHEAFTGDISTPVKRWLSEWVGADHIARLQDKLDGLIFARFGVAHAVSSESMDAVSMADTRVTAAEWRDLMAGPWPYSPVMPAPFAIKPLPSDRAEEAFLKAFARLHAAVTGAHPIPTGIIK
jgi:hypothetical protein